MAGFGEGFASGLSKTISKSKDSSSGGTETKKPGLLTRGIDKLGKSMRSKKSSSDAAKEYPGLSSSGVDSSDDGE